MELDEKTSGLQKGEMIIVAGRPSMGKTALALNIVEYVSMKSKTPTLLVDVFDGGRTMPREAAERLIVEAHQPRPTGDARKRIVAEFLAAYTRRAILVRMVSNLSNIAQRRSDEKAISRYADVILAVDPNNLTHRDIRIQIAMQRGQFDKALADIDWLLEHPDDQIDARQLQLLRKDVEQKTAARR